MPSIMALTPHDTRLLARIAKSPLVYWSCYGPSLERLLVLELVALTGASAASRSQTFCEVQATAKGRQILHQTPEPPHDPR